MTHQRSANAAASQDPRSQVRHGYLNYVIPTYATREEWERRAEHLRRRILVSSGLWPMPEGCALDPHETRVIEHEDYVVHNLCFQVWPGFFCYANLYRPRGRKGPFPGILVPHGHARLGRLFEEQQALGIGMARLGCVALTYDMIGYNEGKLHGVSHIDSSDERTGFFHNYRGYLWGIDLLGLQLWNSIRALDFLSSLPDVDPDRIGCTGASGGGSQTFLLSAIDLRVRVAAPVCMVSAHMQGGCLCENAPTLRLDCTNVEFAALAAPRPMLLVSATGDWTKNTPDVEFPAIQRIYRLYGAAENVAYMHQEAPHNYNVRSREAVYTWFAKHLLGVEHTQEVKEQPFQSEPVENLLVFPDNRLPAHAITGKQLMAALFHRAEGQIRSLRPTDMARLQAYRAVMGVAYQYALNVRQPMAGDLHIEETGYDQGKDYRIAQVMIGQKDSGERIPGLLFVPAITQAAVLVVHPSGKGALVEGNVAGALVSGLLQRRFAVLAIDTFKTGPLRSLERDEGVKHFLTYNLTDTALRVQDILTALSYLRARWYTVHLLGMEQAGLWCLLARGMATGVRHTIVDAGRLDLSDDDVWIKQFFVPHIRRAGDVHTAAALSAPCRLTVHNAHRSFPRGWYHQVYTTAGDREAVHVRARKMTLEEILEVL